MNKNNFLKIPVYVSKWADKYFHQSAFDIPVAFPNKRVIAFLSRFKRDENLKLFRGINKFNRDTLGITSWSHDRKIAEDYIKDGGKIIEKEFVPENVLIDTTVLSVKQKRLLGYDYGVDDKEVLIINKTV